MKQYMFYLAIIGIPVAFMFFLGYIGYLMQ